MKRTAEATILGVFLCAGLIVLGLILANGAIKIKELDRTVTVKGLSEREVNADIAIWPIKFSVADNNLEQLYASVERNSQIIVKFLEKSGFVEADISFSTPAIVDRKAQSYGDTRNIAFRYTATAIITVYTTKVEEVRLANQKLVELGKQGVAIAGQDYESKLQFLFSGLNDIKPQMIEEATHNARQAALKFAKDSDSQLGKIRKARQGQFSINNRDSTTAYIKKVRIVASLEYYLSD